MDVTDSTFHSVLGAMKEEVEACTFVAVDTEFTGLLADAAYTNSLFDDGPRRYQKLCANLRQFSVMQLGLAVYTGIKGRNEYSVRCYNVYLRPHSCVSLDPVIGCQTSSLEFLQRYNFDFNKWLYEGVSYMNIDEIEELRRELLCLFSGAKPVHVSFEVEEVVRGVSDWLVAAQEGDTHTLPAPRHTASLAVVLAALHHTYTTLWPSLTDGQVSVRKVSREERARLEAQDPHRSQLVEAIVSLNTGFTHLFNHLAHLRKPVVLHNGLLDLMLMYKQFHKRLPDSYDSFKSEILQLFPAIYDTKLVAEELKHKYRDEKSVSRVLQRTSLGELATALRGELPVLYLPRLTHHPPGNKYASGEATLHEAGYDAFLTGFCFLRLAHLSVMAEIPTLQHHRPLSPREHLSGLKPYVNKVHLLRSAIHYMSLGGRDPRSRRPPWLVVGGHSGVRVSPGLVVAALAKYGHLDVRPLNPHSVLVATSSWRSVTEILANLSSEGPLKAQVYTRLRHSPLTRSALWSGAVLSTGLCAWLVYRSLRKSPH